MEQEADEGNLAAQHQTEETPLRRYLAALYEGEAATQLLRQIGVYVYYAGLTGEQSSSEIALEVLHETVAAALQAEARFDPTRNAYAWLLGVANNIVKRRREKLFNLNKRETTHSDLRSGTSSASASGSDGEATAEEEIMDRLFARDNPTAQQSLEQQVVEATTLEGLLSQLTPEERRIIELNVLYEMKSAEVAQELGIQEVNARVRFSRARKKLRDLYIAQVLDQQDKQRVSNSVSDAGNKAGNDAVNEEEKHSHE